MDKRRLLPFYTAIQILLENKQIKIFECVYFSFGYFFIFFIFLMAKILKLSKKFILKYFCIYTYIAYILFRKLFAVKCMKNRELILYMYMIAYIHKYIFIYTYIINIEIFDVFLINAMSCTAVAAMCFQCKYQIFCSAHLDFSQCTMYYVSAAAAAENLANCCCIYIDSGQR